MPERESAEPPKDQRLDFAEGVLWPLATGPDRTRWAVQAAELYLHFALFVMRVADTGPAVASTGEPAFPAATVALAQRLYEAIGARLEELGVPSRQRVLCGRCGGRAYTPFPADEPLERWAAFCGTCGITGMLSATGRWTDVHRLFNTPGGGF